MSNFTSQLVTTLQPVILTVIDGVLMAAIPFILMNFNKWMKAKGHNASFHCAMDRLTQHVEAAVLDTFQTYTKAVRKSGNWDEATAETAKAKAMEKLKSLLGPGGLKEVMGCLGQDAAGIEGLFESRLEAAVNKLKQSGHIRVPLSAATPEP